jgi:hypothetical protein
MQGEAEEKDKRYTCIVWSRNPITKPAQDFYEELSKLCTRDVDEYGKPCLQVCHLLMHSVEIR